MHLRPRGLRILAAANRDEHVGKRVRYPHRCREADRHWVMNVDSWADAVRATGATAG